MARKISSRHKEILRPYIRPKLRLVKASGPDGISSFSPYQVIDCWWALDGVRLKRMQVLPFMPSL